MAQISIVINLQLTSALLAAISTGGKELKQVKYVSCIMNAWN